MLSPAPPSIHRCSAYNAAGENFGDALKRQSVSGLPNRRASAAVPLDNHPRRLPKNTPCVESRLAR